MRTSIFVVCFIALARMSGFADGYTTGVISTVAGNGIRGSSGDGGLATSAKLDGISDIAVDSAGNFYIAESNAIRRVSPDGTITTVFSYSAAEIAVDAAGNIYGIGVNRIVKITPAGAVSTVFSIDPAGPGFFDYLLGLVNDPSGNVYFTRSTSFVRDWPIYSVDADGTVSVVGHAPAEPIDLAVDAAGNLYVSAWQQWDDTVSVWKVDRHGGTACLFPRAGYGVAVDRIGNLFITELGDEPRVWMVRPNGITEVVAGNGTRGFSGDGGPATAAQLDDPTSVAVDPSGNILIGDSKHLRIRKVTRGIDYYNDLGMPYNDEDVSFWFNFADDVWYSGNKAGEVSLVGAQPPWQH